MRVITVYLITSFIFFSCASGEREKDRLIESQKTKIEELEQKLSQQSSKDDQVPLRKEGGTTESQLPNATKRYVFAIIETEDRKSINVGGMPSQQTFRVTKVSEIKVIESYSPDKEAEFKDLARKWGRMSKYWMPTVFKVDVYDFPSYEAASKTRAGVQYHEEFSIPEPLTR